MDEVIGRLPSLVAMDGAVAIADIAVGSSPTRDCDVLKRRLYGYFVGSEAQTPGPDPPYGLARPPPSLWR